MKIEIRRQHLGLTTQGSDPTSRELFRYLLREVYPEWKGASWQPVPGKPTVRVFEPYDVDLRHMARMLRAQGWSAYYWRDRHGLDNVDDHNAHINYGRREGLIIGRYCSNLTAWLLANT